MVLRAARLAPDIAAQAGVGAERPAMRIPARGGLGITPRGLGPHVWTDADMVVGAARLAPNVTLLACLRPEIISHDGTGPKHACDDQQGKNAKKPDISPVWAVFSVASASPSRHRL